MANSFVNYTGDDSTTLWTVPFPFISRTHVDVIDLSDSSPITFNWITDAQIEITPAVASTVNFRVRRTTPEAARLVDFQNASNLNEAILDKDSNQLFYIVQETLDRDVLNVKIDSVDIPLSPITLPPLLADAVFKVDSGGTDLEAIPITSIAAGVVGVDVQAWDVGLDEISALTPTDGNFIVGDGVNWITESGNTARTSLGLGTGNSPSFQNVFVTAQVSIAGAIYRDWNVADTDIDALIGSSNFGSIIEADSNGHMVIGLRGNNDGDAFAVISGGGDYNLDSTYDLLCFQVTNVGNAYINKTLGIGRNPIETEKLMVSLGSSGITAAQLFTTSAAVFESDTSAIVHIAAPTTGASILAFSDGGAGLWNSGAIQVSHLSGSPQMEFYTNNNQVMRIMAGKVCIGNTVVPDGTLHVHTGSAGAVTANTTADDLVVEHSDNAGISILCPSTKIGRIAFGDEINNVTGRIQYDHSIGYMGLWVENGERMRLKGTGDVGIGTTNPLVRLHVAEPGTGTVRFEAQDAGSTGNVMQSYHNSASPADNDVIGRWQFRGNTDDGLGGVATPLALFASINVQATNTGDGAEDCQINFQTAIGGSITNRMTIANGAWMGGATGNDFGAGSFNAVDIYDDGTNLNIHWLEFQLVEPTTSVTTGLKKTFTIPFDGVFLQSDTDLYQLAAVVDTAGVTGTMIVDIHKNGTSIMTTNKLDIETTETTTATAATQPDLTTTTFSAGDKLEFYIDAIHTGTAALGCRVIMGVKRTSNG